MMVVEMMVVLRMMAVVMTMMMVLIDDGGGDYDGDDAVMVIFDAVLLLRKGSLLRFAGSLEACYVCSHLVANVAKQPLRSIGTYVRSHCRKNMAGCLQ